MAERRGEAEPSAGGGRAEQAPLDRDLLDLDYVRVDSELARRVPEAVALRRGVLLFARRDDELFVACRDPDDLAALEAVERAASGTAVARRADPASLERALLRIYHGGGEAADGDGAVHTVDHLLRDAIAEGASDIHIEPAEGELRIRFRVDGVLETRRVLPAAQMSAVLNRVKVLADLDIAEHRVPQDGRFTWRGRAAPRAGEQRPVDVRVATLPTRHGERITLRLLSLDTESLTLPRLGMRAAHFETFRATIGAPHGLVLLTGPTGSGKTTTLYAALRELDTGASNVLTIEDPVEYDVPGVSQTEVDQDDRVSFAKALRAALRHDPDVLMVGEIRDLETADVSVKASLTGHLVLSTLHTNSAVSAVTRLIDMGVPPYLVAAVARLFVAQRLVRRLCVHCRAERALDDAERRALGVPADDSAPFPAFEARGCVYCRGVGYSGRLGLFELFAPDADLRAAIAEGRPEGALLRMARERGMTTLREDARAKVRDGLTSLGEALRAVELD